MALQKGAVKIRRDGRSKMEDLDARDKEQVGSDRQAHEHQGIADRHARLLKLRG